MNSETVFCISVFFTIFSVLVACFHFYSCWEQKREMEAIGKAQNLVEEYVYRSLDEIIARRKLKQLYDDCEIEIFLSTFELSDLMQIKLKLEQRLEQLSKEEKE